MNQTNVIDRGGLERFALHGENEDGEWVVFGPASESFGPFPSRQEALTFMIAANCVAICGFRAVNLSEHPEMAQA